MNDYGPGYRLGRGNRLSSLLVRQGRNLNNGSTAGGAAHVLNSALLGLMAGRDGQREEQFAADQTTAMQEMARGMTAKPWQNPDGPDALIPAGSPDSSRLLTSDQAAMTEPKTGGYEGGLAALSGLGTAPAGRLSQDLARRQFDQEARRSARANEMVSTFDPKTGGQMWMRRGDIKPGSPSATPAPPSMRTLQIGSDNVAQEFNPQTGQYMEVGRGPRHAPTRDRRMWAYDNQAEDFALVTESEAMASPRRYTKDAPRRPGAPGAVITLTSPDGQNRVSRHTNDPGVGALLNAGWLRENGGDAIDKFIAAAMEKAGGGGAQPPATVPATANVPTLKSLDDLDSRLATGAMKVGDTFRGPSGNTWRVVDQRGSVEKVEAGHGGEDRR